MLQDTSTTLARRRKVYAELLRRLHAWLRARQ